jgi:hypothetical protein
MLHEKALRLRKNSHTFHLIIEEIEQQDGIGLARVHLKLDSGEIESPSSCIISSQNPRLTWHTS